MSEERQEIELSVDRSPELEALEATVDRGLATFLEVGAALLEIRDKRLYRHRYPTFAHYCQERFRFSDRRARQLIDAVEVGTIVPVQNEGQARELAPLRGDPAKLRAVWKGATKYSKRPTAKALRVAVEGRLPTQEPRRRREVVLAERVPFEAWATKLERLGRPEELDLGEEDLDLARRVRDWLDRLIEAKSD